MVICYNELMICITFSGDFFGKMSSELKNFTRAGELGAIKENTPLWDIAVFGTTQVFHALDFFPVTDVKGVNLAFEVQPFLYDTMLLKRFAGNIRKVPMVNENDEIVVGRQIGFSMGYDHRFLDGMIGQAFDTAFKKEIEEVCRDSLF